MSIFKKKLTMPYEYCVYIDKVGNIFLKTEMPPEPGKEIIVGSRQILDPDCAIFEVKELLKKNRKLTIMVKEKRDPTFFKNKKYPIFSGELKERI